MWRKSQWPSLGLAWLEIRNQKKLSFSFILTLSFGLSALLLVDSLSQSFSFFFKEKSRLLLSADLVLFSRKDLEKEEKEKLKSLLPKESFFQSYISLYTMVANESGKSQLIHLKAIDERYPFYGQLKLENKKNTTSTHSQRLNQKKLLVWPSAEALLHLGSKSGKQLKIGRKTFEIDDIVTEEPGISLSGIGFAPSVFIGIKQLKSTGLIQKGSRISYHQLIKLTDKINPKKLGEKIKKELARDDLKIRTPQSPDSRLERSYRYIADYLSLIAIVSLLLAGIGLGFLFQSRIESRIKDFAVLSCLGASPRTVNTYLFLQIIAMTLLAVLLSALFVNILMPFVSVLLGDFLPSGIQLKVYPQSLFLGIITGLGTSLVFCFPTIKALSSLSPAPLLLGEIQVAKNLKTNKKSLWFTLFLFLTVLTVFISRSWLASIIFLVIFFIATLILFLALLALYNILNLTVPRYKYRIFLIFKNILGNPLASSSYFISFGLAVLFLSLVPQIEALLQIELQSNKEKQASLFLFNIQEEQEDAVKKTVKLWFKKKASNDPNKLVGVIPDFHPMIMARLISINGKSISDKENSYFSSHESEMQERFRSRTYNLSSRAKLSNSESIISGKFIEEKWEETSDKSPALSLEHRFASRIKAKIGDKLKFDLEGFEFTGEVRSLRRVRWSDFNPNFFVLIQRGVLEDAPKTFLAAIHGLRYKEERSDLQNLLVEKFSNISIIDVSQVVQQTSKLLSSMSQILLFLVILSSLVSLLVLSIIVSYQLRRRFQTVALIKLLGASSLDLKLIFSGEFLLLSCFASLVGSLAGTASSLLIAKFIFERSLEVNWNLWLLSFLIPLFLSFVIIFYLLRKFLQKSTLKSILSKNLM